MMSYELLHRRNVPVKNYATDDNIAVIDCDITNLSRGTLSAIE